MNFGESHDLFTPESYRSILEMMRQEDNQELQHAGLQKLSETLLLGNVRSLSTFPVYEMSVAMVHFLGCGSPYLESISARCIYNFLEAHNSSTRALIDNGVLNAIKKVLMKNDIDEETMEFIFRSLKSLSKYQSTDIENEVGINLCVKVLGNAPLKIQKIIAYFLQLITSKIFENSFISSLTSLAWHITKIIDNDIFGILVSVLYNIGTKASTKLIPRDFIKPLYQLILLSNNSSSLVMLTELLRIGSFKCVDEIINYVDFKKLFSKKIDFKIKNNLFLTLVNILPAPNIVSEMWNPMQNQTLSSKNLAKCIQYFLIDLLINDYEASPLSVLTLAMTCEVSQPELPELILFKLCFLIKEDGYFKYILLLALNIKNKTKLVSTGLYKELCNVNTEDEWFNTKLKVLSRSISSLKITNIFDFSKFSDLSSFLCFIKDNNIQAFEFFNDGFYNFLKRLLDNEKNLFRFDFSYLIEKLLELLLILPLKNPVDVRFSNYLDIIKNTDSYKFAINENIYEHPFLSSNSLIAVEYFYNFQKLRIPNFELINQWNRSGRLGLIVKRPDLEKISNTQLGIFHRIFKTPNYRKFSFSINGEFHSEYESLFSVFKRHNNRGILELTEYKDVNKNRNFCIKIAKDNINNSMISVLELLSMIHEKVPEISIYSQHFEDNLYSLLRSFYLIFNGTSPTIQIVLNYPFLFSKSLKILLLKIYSLNIFSSINSFINWKKDKKLQDHSNYVKCEVEREKIFSDGILILENVINSYMHPEIIFKNEEGIGFGPTQEFFSLMAKEFASNSRGMWRNDNNVDDYAMTSTGLFPKIGADEHLFYLFGKLCAKASSLNNIISFPFNIAFFKLIKGEKINIEEVDPQFAITLNNPEGLIGLNFVYPGTEIELIPNGYDIDVTDENLQEFVNLIYDNTCGKELYKYGCAFKDGFYSIYQKDIFDALTPSEMCTLIVGEGTIITMDDLIENVEEYDYEKDSPQIKMLFEIIVEMSNSERSNLIKFITGCERLPIGGLKNLHPKLTIARKKSENGKDDETLPSVMTCTNYFKLPSYSSKEIMRSKILFAISEGNDSFLLT